MTPTRASLLRRGLRSVGVAAMLAAIVWPRPSTLASSGGDVIVVIDVSPSMRVADVAPDRLSVARRTALDVLDAVTARRLAVVAFSGGVRVICPLTADVEAARDVVGQDVDDIGAGGSRVAEALDRAADMASADSLVVLLTDGEPGPEPEAAPGPPAARLRALGARLVVVGVGTVDGGLVPAPGDATSTPHHSRLARSRLSEIAASAGGSLIEAGSLDGARLVGLAAATSIRSRPDLAAVVAFLMLMGDAGLWWLRAETNPWA